MSVGFSLPTDILSLLISLDEESSLAFRFGWWFLLEHKWSGLDLSSGFCPAKAIFLHALWNACFRP